MYRKFIALLAVLFLSISSVSAGVVSNQNQKFFFDDIIDDVVDDIKGDVNKKFTPFTFTIKDLHPDKLKISENSRQLRFILRYRKKFASRLATISQEDFEDAVNFNIDIDSVDGFGDDGDFFDGDIDFSLESRREISKKKGFFEAHFISENIIVDNPQRIKFEFDLEDFMAETGTVTESFSKSPEVVLNFKPIFIDLETITMGNADAIVTDSLDTHDYVELSSTFTSTEELNLDLSDIEFVLTNSKGKKVRPLAKVKRKGVTRKVKFIASVDSVDNLALRKLGVNTYEFRFLVRLELFKPRLAKSFRGIEKSIVSIPFKAQVFNKSGLEMRLRAFAKSKEIDLNFPGFDQPAAL